MKAKNDSTSKPKPTDTLAKVAVAKELSSNSDPVWLFMSQGLPAEGNLQRQWIVDSGTSHTMCSNCTWFSHFSSLTSPVNIVLGDNSTIQGTGVRRITVQMKANGKWSHAILQDVLFIPKLHGNLLSVSQLACHGADVCFAKGGCQIYDQQGVLTCEGTLCRNLYLMPIRVTLPESAHMAVTQIESFPTEGEVITLTTKAALMVHSLTSKADLATWHHHLGHLHVDAILAMAKKGMVKGMEIVRGSSLTNACEACLKGKQTCAEIQKLTESCANQILGRVFSNICELPTCSHCGFEYFVTWIDDASRKVFVNGLQAKSDVATHLKVFIAHAKLDTGKHLKILHTNGGGEYIAHIAQVFLKERGIQHEMTTPDTPQHNGVAERMNHTLLDKVWSMLRDASLPESYWYDVLEHVTLLHNITPTRALHDVTPKEAWSRNKPDISCLHVFGLQAFVHVPEKQCTKLAAKSLTCTFLGYALNRHAYRLVHCPTKHFFELRNIVFDEGGPNYLSV